MIPLERTFTYREIKSMVFLISPFLLVLAIFDLFFVGVIYPVVIITVLVILLRKILYVPNKTGGEITIKLKLRRISYLLIFFILLIPYLFPYLISPLIKWEAEKNNVELSNIVSNLTMNSKNDVEKAYILFNWVHSNIRNTYFSEWKFPIIPPLYAHFNKKYGIYPCIRVNTSKYPSWVLTSKCGACKEYAALFMRMAEEANLTVRIVYNHGEDHAWDEVLIDRRWILVDPSAYMFNGSPSVYEIKWGKVLSYVYAEYSDGTKEDITYRYTNRTTVTFKIRNKNKKPVSNITVYIYSNNLGTRKFTGLTCITNMNGECTVRIGGGCYTIIAKTDDVFPLYGKIKIAVEETRDYTKTITVSRSILHFKYASIFLVLLLASSIILTNWIFLVFLLEITQALKDKVNVL